MNRQQQKRKESISAHNRTQKDQHPDTLRQARPSLLWRHPSMM